LDGKGAYIAVCVDYLLNLQQGAPDQFLAGLSVGVFLGELLMMALEELQANV
jgi:alpha/beta superfamily hydrolase